MNDAEMVPRSGYLGGDRQYVSARERTPMIIIHSRRDACTVHFVSWERRVF